MSRTDQTSSAHAELSRLPHHPVDAVSRRENGGGVQQRTSTELIQLGKLGTIMPDEGDDGVELTSGSKFSADDSFQDGAANETWSQCEKQMYEMHFGADDVV
jgi:hypothetical protein